MTARGIGLRKSHRVVLAALTLASVAGVQLATVAASSSTTVTNPASAKVVNGRFTTTVVLDGGLITVTPAPASVQSQQGIGGMTAKIWATTQLLNFQPQTLGYGIVTVHGTSKTALPIKNLRAWVGFANGNSSACIKKGGSYRSNGEAFVVVGDEKGSAADVYVPPGCGLTRLSGIRVPSEQSSIKWYKEGSASAKGAVTFRATVPHCATYGASTVLDGTGALKVSILAQRPDQSSLTCVPDVVKLSITLAKTAAKANALRLIQAPIGPVREVTGR